MMKCTFIILFILATLSSAYGKVAPEIEPYASGSYGSFKFQDSYKGNFYSAGIGARVGLKLGPLFLGMDAHGQFPYFDKESGTTQGQTDVDPPPGGKLWRSFGGAAGIRTRYFSIMYSYMFDSELQGKIRTTDVPASEIDGEDMITYKYHGTGQKYSAMLHFTENFSVGAEYARYRFNEYTLGDDTHAVSAGDKAGRSTLEVESFSILFNYKIEIELKGA